MASNALAYLMRRYFGLSVAGSTPVLLNAPLFTSIIPAKEKGQYTYTRPSEATVLDHEGVVKPARINEARFSARRVENLVEVCNPESVAGSDWAEGDTPTFQNKILTVNSSADRIYYVIPAASGGLAHEGDTVTFSVDLTYVSGDQASGIRLFVFDGSISTVADLVPDGTTKRFAVTAVGSATASQWSVQIRGQNGTNEVSYRVENVQVERVGGQINKAPGEFVATSLPNFDIDHLIGNFFHDGATRLVNGRPIPNAWNSATLANSYWEQTVNNTMIVHREGSDNVWCQVAANSISNINREEEAIELTYEIISATGSALDAFRLEQSTLISGDGTQSAANIILDTSVGVHTVVFSVNSGFGEITYITNTVVGNLDIELRHISVKAVDHGANVNGVKYFETENWNTIDPITYEVIDRSAEAPIVNARTVTNLMPQVSSNIFNAFVPSGTVVFDSEVDGVNGEPGFRFTGFDTNSGNRILAGTLVNSAEIDHTFSIYARLALGTTLQLQMTNSQTGGQSNVTLLGTGQYERYFATKNYSGVPNGNVSVIIRGGAGFTATEIDISSWQHEDGTAIPSEYVSKGVATGLEQLVTNPDLTSGTELSSADGWENISQGTGIIFTFTATGIYRFIGDGSANRAWMEQQVDIVEGQVYVIEIKSAEHTSGALAFRAGTTTQSNNEIGTTALATESNVTSKVVYTATYTGVLFIGINTNAASTVSEISRISMRTCDHGYFDIGVTQAYLDDIKAFDTEFANTTSGVLVNEIVGNTLSPTDGYFTEGERVNLIQYSQDLTQAGWIALSDATVANYAEAPDGTITASRVIDDGLTGTNNIGRYRDNITLLSNQPYTYSAYFKADQLEHAVLRSYAFDVAANARTWFHIPADGSGSVGTSEAGHSNPKLTYLKDGWYRAQVTLTTVTDLIGGFVIEVAEADGQVPATRDGTSSILVWGVQVEQGLFPSSYIPTEAATITRNADQLTVDNTNILDAIGTAYAEAKFENDQIPTGNARILGCNGGVNHTIMAITNAERIQSWDGTSTSTGTEIVDPTLWMYGSTTWEAGNTMESLLNGGTAFTSPAYDGSFNLGTDPIAIGHGGQDSNAWFGNIRNIKTFKKRHTLAKRQELTS